VIVCNNTLIGLGTTQSYKRKFHKKIKRRTVRLQPGKSHGTKEIQAGLGNQSHKKRFNIKIASRRK
jgi:hypothetical protein